MPSTYAHYRHGKLLLERLPEAQRRRIERYREIYDIGLHGPDILFYHHPLKPDPVRRLGSLMHERPMMDFLVPALSHVRGLSGEEREAACVYLLGFIGHFSLDSACHPYVEQRVRETGVTHTEIEVELDRRLMEADGCPERCPIEHIIATAENARVIAPFYEGVSEDQVRYALRSMRRLGRLLDARLPGAKRFIRAVTARLDPSGELPGWMATGHNPKCDETCAGLIERFETGLRRAEKLFGEFDALLAGEAEPNPLYRENFGAD